MITGLMVSLLAFALVIGVIVFIHEYGHFGVARLLGVRVDSFSIGFGRTLWSRKDKKGTEWKLCLLPLGGYVKFHGDQNPASLAREDTAENREQRAQKAREGHFSAKPLWARALVVLAGPVANFLLAWVLFMGLLAVTGNAYLSTRIGAITEDGAAAQAGIEVGDVVLAVDGDPVTRFSQLVARVAPSAERELLFEIERGSRVLEIPVVPRLTEREDSFGNPLKVGMIGVTSDRESFTHEAVPLHALPGMAAMRVVDVLATSLRFLGGLFLGGMPFDQLGGPVKIAQIAGQSASAGFIHEEASVTLTQRLTASMLSLLQLCALLSVSVGFLNLLPVPVLDGGHLLFYAYEAVFRRPLSVKIQSAGMAVGLALILSLMAAVTITDVSNLLAQLING